MTLLLFACAAETSLPDTVELEWHQERVSCVDGDAEWDAAEDAVFVSVVRYEAIEAGDYTSWQSGIATTPGAATASIACQDDVLVTYAITK